MNPTFLHAAATLTDFDLCNQLCLLIEDRYGYPILPKHDVPEELRVVWEIWSSSGFILCEGLVRYFEIEADRQGLADAYQVIGMPQQAEILQLFLPHLPATDAVDLTKESLCKMCGLTLEQLNDAETTFFRQEKNMEGQLAWYVRSRLKQFEGLPLRDPPFSDERNVAYLRTARSLIKKFASKNNGIIPTFPELQNMTMHSGFRKASPSDYEILLQGNLKDHPPETPLMRYMKPILSYTYYITVNGGIKRY